MGNKSSSIIINGKVFDADAGTFKSSGGGLPVINPMKSPGVIDGFTRTRSTATAVQPKTARVPQKADIEGRPAGKRQHTPAHHIAAHKPEHARTLMRSAVKKPNLKAATKISVQAPADTAVYKPEHIITPKVSHFTVDPVRQKRAQRVMQSPAVSRFGTPGSLDAIAPYSPELHLKPLPAKDSPVEQIPVVPVSITTPQPDIFQQALVTSVSHEQTYTPKKNHRARLTIATSASLVFLLVLGIFAYINVPSISVHLASAKAGFAAKLPGYTPVGFSFGTLSYGPGNVTVSYKDNQPDGSQFDITQRSSTWDSTELLNNFVASANKSYQMYERGGRTIYVYGDNTATWVSGGVWYTVDGSSALTRGQLLDLANSL